MVHNEPLPVTITVFELAPVILPALPMAVAVSVPALETVWSTPPLVITSRLPLAAKPTISEPTFVTTAPLMVRRLLVALVVALA